MLRFVPALTIAVFLAPVVVGFAGTALPAFGVLPAIGATALSLEPWRTLAAAPGLSGALATTVVVGLASSVLSIVLALALCMALVERPWFRRAQAAATPLIAAPHAAVALGLAFVLAPSGWIARAISPELTGWTRPPAWLVTVGDPYGAALVVGLLTKEIPYLLVMIAAALGQVPVTATLRAARSMGYRRHTAFLKLVLPRLWPQVRLPFYAVVAYSFSVVDQALVLGPSAPPTLSVMALRWFSDFDVAQHLPAAAAALTQAVIVAVALAVAWATERTLRPLGRRFAAGGGRRFAAEALVAPLAGLALVVLALGLLGLLSLVVWSVAEAWRFPDALPETLTLSTWMNALGRVAPLLATTLLIAALSTGIALALCLGCLEQESRAARAPGEGALMLIYLPLLVPHVAFLFGVQVLFVRLGVDGSIAAVVLAHLVFVVPYVFLSLSDPWRALDPRYARGAASLGASPSRIFFAVKLPMLLRPILVAGAVGVAVGVGLYLPTVFAGAGRVATITTEALTIASGGDRRAIAVYGFLQSALPLACYAFAIAIPAWAWRNRRGLA